MKLFRLIMYPPLLCGMGLLMTDGTSRFRRMRHESRRRAFPGRPPWQRNLMITAIAIGWYAFAGWAALYRGLRMAGRTAPKERIYLEKLLPDLLWLIFWLGAQPSGYFAFGLHALPRSRWEAFVFRQEHAHWQNAFGDAKVGRACLQDKAGFAEQLSTAGLPSVPTTRRLIQGTTLTMKDLTDLEEVFIKPNSANAMRGCLKLARRDGELHLSGTDMHGKNLLVSGASAPLEKLNEQLQETECLVQPLLKNHSAIRKILSSEQLITLRVITIKQPEPAILYALLEVPGKNPSQWMLANIDATTGEITPSRYPHSDDAGDDALKDAYNQHVPRWKRCRETVLRAHELVPDLLTVGWDLAIAEAGPILIEGNAGWDVNPPQMVTGRPLLAEISPPTAGLPESIT